MSARDPIVEGRSVAGRLHHDDLEQAVLLLLQVVTDLVETQADAVFAQPPLTDDELEAAA